MHPAICSAFWMAPAVLASSCSLLFNEKPGELGDASAPTVDSRSPASCGDSFDDTLSFYPVEQDTATLIDVNGLANGQPYVGQDLSTTTEVLSAAGPCGTALFFDAPTATEQWFVAIDSSGHREVPLSVDLWVKLAPGDLGNRASILARDQNTNNPADFTMAQIQDGEDARILIRTQSDSLTQYTCSGILNRESWHHVAVSIGDGMDVRLFVDGVRVEQTGDTVMQDGQAVVCQDANFELGVNMSQNQWPWIVGGSNGESTPTNFRVDEFFKGGAIDNLRIRRASFTQQEAMAIFAP